MVVQKVKHLPAMWKIHVRYLGWEDPLEKEMATHSSTLAWKIPWTEEPGGLQSMGSQTVGHDWATSLSFFPSKTKNYTVLLMRKYEEVKLVFKYWDLNTLKFNHIFTSKSSLEIVPEINCMKDFFLVNVKILFTCFSQYDFNWELSMVVYGHMPIYFSIWIYSFCITKAPLLCSVI